MADDAKTPDEKRLIQLYESGLSTRQCGELFGRSASWAKLRLRRLGVPMRSTGDAVALARHEEFDDRQLVTLYESGGASKPARQTLRAFRKLGRPPAP